VKRLERGLTGFEEWVVQGCGVFWDVMGSLVVICRSKSLGLSWSSMALLWVKSRPFGSFGLTYRVFLSGSLALCIAF
jgi:hypothetical protein